MSRLVLPLLALALMVPGHVQARAAVSHATAAALPVVKPVMPCEALAKADVTALTGVPTKITSASVLTTPKGNFCKVLGTVSPSIAFEADQLGRFAPAELSRRLRAG